MNNSKISIALTTFNGQLFIKDQLNSILNQTITPNEIVIIDDKSTDDTCSIIRNFESSIPIFLYVNSEKLGVNSNFEKAISLCTGDYIAISDQDDVWLNDKLELLIQRALNINTDLPILIRSNSYVMNYNLTINYGPVFLTEQPRNLYKRFFYPNAQGAGMLLNYKLKKAIIPFPKDIHAYDFYIAMMAEIIGKSEYVNKPLMLYRIHSNNAVGISEILPIKKRIIKAIKGNYEIGVPGAFITLNSILNRESNRLDEEYHHAITNILNLVSSKISISEKIKLVLRNKMSTRKSRIILCLKLIKNSANRIIL
jgi:glycosyltransferase involved in cell wall biosynthesis